MTSLSKLWRAYKSHEYHARHRGILFLLSFEEWLHIWEASGKLLSRGTHKGQYVMARYGDSGPYSVENVRIITNSENTREWVPTPTQKENHRKALLGNSNRVGSVLSPAHASAIRAANIGNSYNLGNKHTPEARAKMRAARAGRSISSATRAKLSKAALGNTYGKKNKGRVCSPETRAKISAAKRKQSGMAQIVED